eukprot:3784090-Rhodomonas_salina.2
MEEKCKEFIAKDGWKCQVCYLRRACCENPGTDVSEHALHTSCTSSSAPCTSARGSGTGQGSAERGCGTPRWETYVYLKGEDPIMINSNYYIMDGYQWTPTKHQLPSSRARPERLSSARPLSIFPRNNSTTHALCRQPSSSALTRACAAHEQAARTASLVLEADGFKKLIDYEQLEPVRQGGVIPWCMKQVPLRPFLFLFLSPRHLALALAPLAFVFPSSA